MKRTLIFAAVLLAAFFSSAGPSRSSEQVTEGGLFTVNLSDSAAMRRIVRELQGSDLDAIPAAVQAAADESCRERLQDSGATAFGIGAHGMACQSGRFVGAPSDLPLLRALCRSYRAVFVKLDVPKQVATCRRESI